jgi:hypothetical protein
MMTDEERKRRAAVHHRRIDEALALGLPVKERIIAEILLDCEAAGTLSLSEDEARDARIDSIRLRGRLEIPDDAGGARWVSGPISGASRKTPTTRPPRRPNPCYIISRGGFASSSRASEPVAWPGISSAPATF